MAVIVKVQVPIASSVPRGSVGLVYAAGRKRMVEQELPEAVLAAMDGKPKAFFEADWTGRLWTIGKPAPWQAW